MKNRKKYVILPFINTIIIIKFINIHLETALHHISDRDNPHYQNSKESISAVEALCVKIVKQNKTTLGKTLNIIKNNSKNTILMN